MDLKAWGNYHFLVLVDVATRFCAARVIRNKEPSTIMKGIFLSWITHFGAPKEIFSDNGGEFNNEEMKALGEAYNIKILTTPAESPWSNGVVERLNGVIGNHVDKIIGSVLKSTDQSLLVSPAVQVFSTQSVAFPLVLSFELCGEKLLI